jgi:hypothetical protein
MGCRAGPGWRRAIPQRAACRSRRIVSAPCRGWSPRRRRSRCSDGSRRNDRPGSLPSGCGMGCETNSQLRDRCAPKRLFESLDWLRGSTPLDTHQDRDDRQCRHRNGRRRPAWRSVKQTLNPRQQVDVLGGQRQPRGGESRFLQIRQRPSAEKRVATSRRGDVVATALPLEMAEPCTRSCRLRYPF